MVPARAWADTYYAQTAGIQQHAEADALVEQVRTAGIEAEIVRSFQRGSGWELAVRTLTTEDSAEAHGFAVRLAELSGRTTRVFVVAGHDALPVDDLSVLVASPGGEPGGAAPGQVGAAEGGGDVRAARGAELLAAVALAHGGGSAGPQAPGEAQAGGWAQVHCRYERRIVTEQGVLRVGHEYWRDGEALRLDVRILEGVGQDSVAIARGTDAAWLQVGGELHEVVPGPTREGLLAFAPEAVLGQALAIRAWGVDRPALVVDSPAEGGDLAWMELDPGNGGERLLVGVDPGDHRVRELALRGGEDGSRWRFADYQELGDGLIVPLKSETLDGGESRERLVFKLLERGAPIDPAVFDPGSLKTP
jgi:hypothetical protein